MSSINKIMLVGHLGKDPELRLLDHNVAVVSFPLATAEYITKNGEKTEQTEWHNIVMWRGIAENAAKILHKGRLIYLEGKIRTHSYNDGEGIKRYTTEIIAENFRLLGKSSEFEKKLLKDT